MLLKAYVAGDKNDIEYLFRHLSANGVTVEKDATGYLVFSRTGDVQNAKKELVDFARLLSGISCLYLDASTPLRINHYVEIRDDGSQRILLGGEEEVKIRDTLEMTIDDGENVRSLAFPGDLLAETLRLATVDRNVAKVAALLAEADLSWINLYRVYETICDDLGGERELASRDWCKRSTLFLFRRTANSYSAIGVQARHAAESTQPPTQPMAWAEARAMVVLLAHEWLGEKRSARP